MGDLFSGSGGYSGSSAATSGNASGGNIVHKGVFFGNANTTPWYVWALVGTAVAILLLILVR